MSEAVRLGVAEAETLVARAFVSAGLHDDAAHSTARALIAAEADGQKGHGLARVASYVEQIRCGKVLTDARPQATRLSQSATLIDAGHGFAYPAIDLAIDELVSMTRSSVIGLAGVSVRIISDRPARMSSVSPRRG